MNIVIVNGEIISEINFNFIYNYNKYKKENYTSIAMCKIKLENDSIIDIYGYDDIADYLYRENPQRIYLEGELDEHMMIKINNLYQAAVLICIWI